MIERITSKERKDRWDIESIVVSDPFNDRLL